MKQGLILNSTEKVMTASKFDRMIPSGSSWLIGVKVKRIIGQAHTMIEPGKKIPIQNYTT